MEHLRHDFDPHVPVVPNPTQLAAYKWLLRFLFTDGDAPPPPPPPPQSPALSRAAVTSPAADRRAS